ncbi:hypothetical protein ACTIVE_8929 [Actinomadura verrucosospora]|uniref:Uncharacterized protein n=1 Tax=Actinomadura verrucosospora TaxID=46165 RepID=A0A7D3W2W7_ACTVE|nr:hypothetical protein ACTIVE_8929 [Actinomadura verrucosospora]
MGRPATRSNPAKRRWGRSHQGPDQPAPPAGPRPVPASGRAFLVLPTAQVPADHRELGITFPAVRNCGSLSQPGSWRLITGVSRRPNKCPPHSPSWGCGGRFRHTRPVTRRRALAHAENSYVQIGKGRWRRGRKIVSGHVGSLSARRFRNGSAHGAMGRHRNRARYGQAGIE